MTTLVRFREPLRNVAMNAEFERLINTVLDSPARSARAWAPPLDVWETEGELVYAFDMPGIPEDKIAVEIEDNTLTVSGSRKRTRVVMTIVSLHHRTLNKSIARNLSPVIEDCLFRC